MANVTAKTSSNIFYKARCEAATHNEQLSSREGAADYIGFDARLVIETLKAFDCDNVGISLHSPRKYEMSKMRKRNRVVKSTFKSRQ